MRSLHFPVNLFKLSNFLLALDSSMLQIFFNFAVTYLITWSFFDHNACKKFFESSLAGRVRRALSWGNLEYLYPFLLVSPLPFRPWCPLFGISLTIHISHSQLEVAEILPVFKILWNLICSLKVATTSILPD